MNLSRMAVAVSAMAVLVFAGCSGDDDDSPPAPTGNVAPYAADVFVQTVRGTATVQILFAGSDANGDAVTFAIHTNPAVGTAMVMPDGTGSYAPPAGFAGTITFKYVAHDGALASAPATVTVQVDNDSTPDPYLVSAQLWVDNNINSDTDDGHQGISADGRYVAFTASANNLISPDSNGFVHDVFVRDMQTGEVEVVSKDSAGTQGNSQSYGPILSDDARFVLFRSYASNLVASDTNATYDIFLHDRTNHTTVRITEASGGIQANGASYNYDMSGDGRYVAFTSSASNLSVDDTDGTSSVFLKDRTTGTITYIAPAQNSSTVSRRPQVSDDGSIVLFKSDSANLVPGDTNGRSDLFLWRRATGTFVRVNQGLQPSEPDGGGSTPAISGDGSKIAFLSGATNLVVGGSPNNPALYVYDVATAVVMKKIVEYRWSEPGFIPALSYDGRYLVYKGGAPDGSMSRHLWKMDLNDWTSTLVGPPPGSSGGGSYVAISPDARYAAFVSGADNLVPGDFNGQEETFWVDTFAGPTSVRRVSEIPPSLLTAVAGGSWSPACSTDGRFVAYMTSSGNVTLNFDNNGYDDVVLHDVQTGVSTLVALNGLGRTCNGNSSWPDVADGGNLVVFSSEASDVTLDVVTWGRSHIYLKDVAAGTMVLVSKDSTGDEGDSNSRYPSISDDGTKVLFGSQAANLTIDADNNAGGMDIYSYNVLTGAIALVSRATGGGSGNGASQVPRVSGDGSICVFESDASDLIAADANAARDIFRVSLAGGAIARVSVGDGSPGAEANGSSYSASMNRAGTLVAFHSAATNLTSQTDTNAAVDVFVRDTAANTTTLVSRSTTAGQTGNAGSFSPSISPDGRYVAFASNASDLIAGDTNGVIDVFVFDRTTSAIVRVAENADNPVISDNGLWVFYASAADNNVYRTAGN